MGERSTAALSHCRARAVYVDLALGSPVSSKRKGNALSLLADLFSLWLAVFTMDLFFVFLFYCCCCLRRCHTRYCARPSCILRVSSGSDFDIFYGLIIGHAAWATPLVSVRYLAVTFATVPMAFLKATFTTIQHLLCISRIAIFVRASPGSRHGCVSDSLELLSFSRARAVV